MCVGDSGLATDSAGLRTIPPTSTLAGALGEYGAWLTPLLRVALLLSWAD